LVLVWEGHAGLGVGIAAVDDISGVIGYLRVTAVGGFLVAGGVDKGWR